MKNIHKIKNKIIKKNLYKFCFSQLNHTFNSDLYILRIVNMFIISNSHYFTKSNTNLIL